jgi:DNA-binding NtrC family response regulator
MSLEESGLTEQSFREAKRELVNRFERNYVEDALRKSNGNITRAAYASKKARRAFFELMKKHNVNSDDFVIDLSMLEASSDSEEPLTVSSAAGI